MESFYPYLKNYLSDDFISEIKESQNHQPFKGFVLNTTKIKDDELCKFFKNFTKSNQINNLYYYNQETTPLGKSLIHEAGGVYIMDPSATINQSLIAEDNLLVLDLCAAPGGKTISFSLTHPNSLIVANDYSYKRAIELCKNIIRLGLNNVIVTSFPPSYFLNEFKNTFDLIILDAPCSGTGMFRKETKMLDDWSYKKTLALLPIQEDLLNTSYLLLKEGGKLIYSTCSFLKEEDEDQVNKFLNKYHDMHLIDFPILPSYFSIQKGTIHLFPHLFNGEGHFISLFKKDGETAKTIFNNSNKLNYNSKNNLITFKYNNLTFGLNKLYPPLLKLKALKMGIQIEENDKYAKAKFTYAYARYQNSNLDTINLDYSQAKEYIYGNELTTNLNLNNDTYIVTYNNLHLGLVNKRGNKLKNLYLKENRKKIIDLEK